MRDYVATRCFGQKVDLESDAIRSHLSRLEIQEGIAKYLARKIAELTIDRRAIEFERANYRLSETKPFSWRRNLPPLVAKKTVFNYVATYNDFERRFALPVTPKHPHAASAPIAAPRTSLASAYPCRPRSRLISRTSRHTASASSSTSLMLCARLVPIQPQRRISTLGWKSGGSPPKGRDKEWELWYIYHNSQG